MTLVSVLTSSKKATTDKEVDDGRYDREYGRSGVSG